MAPEPTAAGAEEAAVVDPVDVLCDRAICPTIKDGRVLYRAHLHAGAAGSRLLTEDVSTAIRLLVGQ